MLLKLSFILLFSLGLFLSCKQISEHEQMLNTTQKVFDAIENGKPEDFISLIRPPLHVIGKDEEMVAYDLEKLKKAFKKYKINRNPVINDSINYLGQKTIIIFKELDSLPSGNVKYFQFDIQFGPPDINPLKKISGYNLSYID